MKKIVASVGLVALGASSITASAQALTGPDASKPWSVSATLRGFYDDNPGTVPNDVYVKDRDSFGFEVSPSATLSWALEATTINIGLLYSLKYYDTKPPGSTDHADQVFTANVDIAHSFSEQFKMRVADAFVVGQEPDLLRSGNTFSTFQRVSGDNIRNHATLELDGQLTPVIGLGFGYDNAYYDYKNGGETIDLAGNLIPSMSALLDRMEHRAHLEGYYSLAPETKLLLGYRFMEIDYTASEFVAGNIFIPGSFASADARNSREHSIYAGAEHNFSPNLTGAIRAGASFTDYFNDPTADDTVTPYVNATLRYGYAPGSYVEGGFSYDRNATDVASLAGAGNYTLDAQSAVVFASVKHQLDPRLFLGVLGQFQNSTYNGGAFDGESEQYYLAGVDLEYRFNQYFSGHIGYNYDNLQSDLGRAFDRNRVYIGVTASY